MAITYLKKSPKTSSTDDTKTREIVENILKDIEQTKEEGCKEYSKKLPVATYGSYLVQMKKE